MCYSLSIYIYIYILVTTSTLQIIVISQSTNKALIEASVASQANFTPSIFSFEEITFYKRFVGMYLLLIQYVGISVHTHTYMFVYTYIYIYIQRERERWRERRWDGGSLTFLVNHYTTGHTQNGDECSGKKTLYTYSHTFSQLLCHG